MRRVLLWVILLVGTITDFAFGESAPYLFEVSFEETPAPIKASSEKYELKGSPKYIDGIKGKAIVLQQGRDWLFYPTQGNMNKDSGSLSLWLKAVNYTCDQPGHKVFWQVGDLHWLFYWYDKYYLLFGVNGKGNSLPSTTPVYSGLSKDKWTHYVLTWDRKTGRIAIYMNGRLLGVAENVVLSQELPSRFSIGPSTDWGSHFETAYDECRIYNRPLNESEVAALYASYLPEVECPATRWSVPRASSVPKIDGTIDPKEWGNAASFTGFVGGASHSQFSTRQTVCWMMWDEKNLYLAFRSPQRKHDDVLITTRGRDAAAFTDESYEIILWPEIGNQDLYYQFVGSLGALYDARNGQMDWNSPDVQQKISQHDGVFDEEFAIPFKDIGVAPKSGFQIKAVLARNFCEGEMENSAWTRFDGLYKDWKNAGIMTLTQDSPVVRIQNGGRLCIGEAAPSLELVNPSSKKINVRYDLWLGESLAGGDGTYTTKGQIELSPNERKVISPKWDQVKPYLRIATLKVSDASDVPIAQVQFPFTYNPKIEGKILTYPSKNRLEVRIDTRGIVGSGSTMKGIAFVQDLKEKQMALEHWTTDTDGFATVGFDFQKWPIGEYRIVIQADNKNGEWTANWNKLDPKPDWLIHPVGMERIVPRPFTPIQFSETNKNITVSMWGRTYRWNRGLIPVDILTQNESLLSEPAKISGQVNGKKFADPVAEVSVQEKAKDSVRFTADSKVSGLRIRTENLVEYDGMLLMTFDLSPVKPGESVQLEKLAVEFPFKSQDATLLHYNGCSCSGGGWAGETPEKLFMAHSPIMWLGNENLGLCFFRESDKGFNLRDQDHGVELVKRGKTTYFRMEIYDRPTKIDRPIRFQFGLIATPLRPLPKNWLCWYYDTVVHFMPDWSTMIPDQEITSWDTVVSVPWWDDTDSLWLKEFRPWSDWAAEKAYHVQRKRKMVMYTQTYTLGDTPENRFWRNEWECWPVDNHKVCVRSDFRHLVAEGMANRIRTGKADGLYFDLAFPQPCANSLHGCEGGYAILAQRDLRKRLAEIFEEEGRESLIFEHMSMNMYGPMMSHASAYLDGEEFSGHIVDDYRKVMNLGFMRAMLTGKNWGIVPFFLGEIKTTDPAEAKRASNSIVAMLTLHIPIHSSTALGGPVYNAAYKLDRKFFFTPDTQRYGYWENQNIVQVTPDDVKVTLYAKPGKIFFVASNLTDKEIVACIDLKTQSLGFDPLKLKLVDTLKTDNSDPILNKGQIRGKILPGTCIMGILESQ